MRKIFIAVTLIVAYAWSVSKPMESITNYNVLMVHGAYGSEKGIKANADLKEADSTSEFLGNATLGSYTSDDRITKWIGTNIFEEPDIGKERNPSNAYIYNWRSFTNPANSSLNNAYELAYRKWNAKANDNSKFGKRRAFFEEAQEVKAVAEDDSGKVLYGQAALELIRKNSDLYRQLASRYILIGHSMGGVVSREYVQGDFYNGDVDKIITLDSPHEGTGALNMQIYKEARGWTDEKIRSLLMKSTASMVATGVLLAVMGMDPATVEAGMCITLFSSVIAGGASIPLTRIFSTEIYTKEDSLVHYVDPYQTGFGTIRNLNGLPYDADKLPMFRILGSKNSMTFGDPTHVDYGPLGSLYLENFSLPVLNMIGQMGGNGDLSTIYVNALTAGIAGIVGIPLIEQGSSLVTESSGLGKHVRLLNDKNVDVRREQFNAAVQAESSDGDFATAMGITSGAVLALDFTLGLINPAAAKAAKAGIVVAFSTTMGFSVIGGAIATGFDDLAESHQMPLYKKNLEKWFGNANSFSLVNAGSSEYTPYLMEDFFYERPFVNLALNDSRTMDSLSKVPTAQLNKDCFFEESHKGDLHLCEVGLYGNRDSIVGVDTTVVDKDTSYDTTRVSFYGSFKKADYKTFKQKTIAFKSATDWDKMGVKLDRWEMVDGLTPNGEDAPNSVPIRHVERYEVPAITVDNWIEKYSFVVDDLMPHRLRQIRMNFNFVSEIAWECDVTKSENDETACTVYKRSAGEEWKVAKKIGKQGKVRHPVKKNGQFDFNPHDYGYDNLFAIQKDNQNTVVISTVNKIGLSNTQRFYYLFKATENVLKSNWPERDVVLNRIEGFEAFASVTDYQGFRVDSAYDIVYKGDDIEHGTRLRMRGIPNGAQDMDFNSLQQMDTLSDGEYTWQFRAYATNNTSGDVDSAKFYNASFSLDRVAPKFSLYTDNSFVNPDNANFIVRYKWNGGASTTPDVRVMRWNLDSACTFAQGDTLVGDAECSGSISLPAMYDVAAREFAISWDKIPANVREKLTDGLYRVKAYALDYAVPNRLMYDSVNALVDRIMSSPNDLTDADWKLVIDSSGTLNDTTVYAMFRVDKTAPVVTDITSKAVAAVDTVGMSPATGFVFTDLYASLPRPARNNNDVYVAEDSLLEISYKVKETSSGEDSALALLAWDFEHVGDSLKIDRAGDSVWVKSGFGSASWKELSGLHLVDGVYKIRVKAHDRAGNMSSYDAPKLVRVDRTAPNITSLVSRRLVYPDSDRAFSATIKVNQLYDADSNRTGMYCYYRVSGGDADRVWRSIMRDGRDSLLSADSIDFAINAAAVGSENGVRYLESVCIDAAGNSAVRTDLFHVGFRSPNIVYPVTDKTESSERLIPIVGVAPPLSSSDSLTAVYRLRYKKCDDADWLDDKIDVIAANRQQGDSLHNYSRISQSAEGVLGYLKNEGFDDDNVCIELAVASCSECNDWRTAVSTIVLKSADEDSSKSRPTVVFDVSKSRMVADSDSVNISLHLEGVFNSCYLLRVYAEDANGVGLKEWSLQKAWRNPYYGLPADSVIDAASAGVWFYQDSLGIYHLRWKNIGDSLNLQILFDSEKMGMSCNEFGGANKADGCNVESMPFDFSSFAGSAKTYLEDYPEWIPPSHIDSVMKIAADAGHVVFDAQGAFRITTERPYGMDSSKITVPVYFGDAAQEGFYWVQGMDKYNLSPLTTGWTVDPQGYGLNVVWDGLAETTAFPAERKVKLVAEVTENTTDAPYVYVETKMLDVELPALKVVLPNSLPDFLVLNKNFDNGDSVLYHLDSMDIHYGIKNKDAVVWMYIKDSKGEVVSKLLDSAERRAFASDSVYSACWSGKNAFQTPSTAEGEYTVVIEAKSIDGLDSASSSAKFNVKYAESMLKMTPDDPKNAKTSSIYVSEAQKDGNKYRYEPVADYLVRSGLSGWALPDSLRDSLTVKAIVTGKQKPFAFDAKNFSLGILRQRDSLDLVLWAEVEVPVVEASCDWFGNSVTDDGYRKFTYLKLMHFNTKDTSKSYLIEGSVGDLNRGISGNKLPKLKLYAFPYYKVNELLQRYTIRDLGSLVTESIWDRSFVLPLETEYNLYDKISIDSNYSERDVGCIVDTLNVSGDGDCHYSNSSYNPNARLFNVSLIPKETFYSDWGQINNECSVYNARRHEDFHFYIKLTIPKTYWNAGFGYDNLVNRTIRFDATNSTIYGESSGYLPEIEKTQGLLNNPRRNNYFDGTKWTLNKKYGRVTAFETQHLPFFKASEMEVDLNTFLFPGEIADFRFESSSRFTFKFYGKDIGSHYKVDVFAKKVNGESFRDSLKSLTDSTLETPTLKHGDMDIYVSYNKIVAETDKFFKDTTTGKWIDFPLEKDGVPENNDTVKYYAAASRIHYYLGDYDNPKWKSVFSKGKFFRNLSNTTSESVNLINATLNVNPNSIDELDLKDSMLTKHDTSAIKIALNPNNYMKSSHRFYATLGKAPEGEAGLQYTMNFVMSGLDPSLYGCTSDSLYVNAREWNEIVNVRRTEYNLDIPKKGEPVRIEMDKIYKQSPWQKEVVLDSTDVVFLDSSEHTHFESAGNVSNTSDVLVQYKDVVGDKRIPEFVELRAYLKGGLRYSLAYMNGNKFYSIPDSLLDSAWRNGITPQDSGDYRLGWFNVNKLQGNTQFLLTWGDKQKDNAYCYSTFDMIVGGSVVAGLSRTVLSPLEDASVTFSENSLTENKNITVRTIDAKDYSFDVFNNLALKGPIVEVLPSMTFTDSSALPRVQMKISREEMIAMSATPQTVRLYKVDFTGKKFVPLENALYGFLNADGSAVLDGAKPLQCDNKSTDSRCAGNDTTWAYLLISAETKTFSVFTAMDSTIAETPNFSVTVLPEIASTANRTIRVDGISRYKLYVDDDSLWANRDDVTSPDTLAFTADSNGFAHVTLPLRNNNIDTSFVFVVALSEPDSNGSVVELPAAPAVARALTVNAQFACSVPSDSLWLGLDNGYMAYGASCTHPGYGLVLLYRDGRIVAEIRGEIPDTIIYDGAKTSGTSRLGKISTGVYESRYVGVSALGMDMQMAGPRVYTDSLRPAIRNFSVQDSSEVLDRIFTATADVYDSESGIARVVVTPVFGGDTLRVLNVLPDSVGHVSASVRISRKQLAECTGCYLSMEVRVEDYGHNHAEQKHVSEKLYPYPTELALWYPARESGGSIVHELLGTGHDLDLYKKMKNPWGSDVGLYFENKADYAVGKNGLVDFGSTPSYSFEARVKPGNPNDDNWHEILSFKGVNAIDIHLLQNKRALKLVEGTHVWKSGSILPTINKSWSHVVVTVDSAFVKFYVDGELKKTLNSGISLEREMEGVFSMGKAGREPSYIGNIADIRMYSRALTAAEVEELSKPVTDAGEVSDIIVVAVKDMDAVSGFSNQFSCSVAGNKYLESSDSATLTMSVIVENAADYNVVLYARSVIVGDKLVYVGESSLLAGMASVSNTWRAVTVSGVSVHLAAGTHTLTLRVPAGVQIGGAALTTANIPASMIAWGVSTSDKVAGITPADTVRKVKSYLRYEGYPETSTLRPRIRLRNVSNEPLNGFSVRYYFRGEDAATASVERYWPNNVETFPAVHSESANTGYVEWTFTETIPVAGTVFSGDGPHFGLFSSGNIPWDASDDPSFVDPYSGLAANIDGFYEDVGVIVLDSDNNLIGGSCAEMEDSVSLEAKVRVLASDIREDHRASEIHFKVENTGNVVLKNFDVRYYFFVEEGLAPDYELDDKSECTSALMESLGSGRWQVTIHCDKPLAAGKTWQNPVKVALHLPGWAEIWNANDDPSHDSLETTVRETRGICVFDSTGYMLYGNVPAWTLPTPDEISPDSAYHVDFGFRAPGSIPVIRTPDGLVLTLDNWTYVELSLVTVLGQPVKSIYNGTLAPGEQLVRVDWTGIDMSKTYLMLKVNGTIKSTKKLSLL